MGPMPKDFNILAKDRAAMVECYDDLIAEEPPKGEDKWQLDVEKYRKCVAVKSGREKPEVVLKKGVFPKIKRACIFVVCAPIVLPYRLVKTLVTEPVTIAKSNTLFSVGAVNALVGNGGAIVGDIAAHEGRQLLLPDIP